MSWQFLVLINALCVGSATVIIRSLARDRLYKSAALATNAYQYIFLWTAGLLFLPELGVVRAAVLPMYWWHFIGGGLAFALVNVTIYKTLSYVDAAIGSVFNTISVLFTVVLAAVVLHQRLSSLQLIGAAVLMTAIIYSILIFRARHRQLTSRQVEMGMLYSVLSGVCFAVAIVNEQWLLQRMDASSYIVFGWGFQVLGAVMLMLLFQREKIKPVFFGHRWPAVITSGLLRGVGGAAFVLAQIRSDNVAVITVIANFKLVVVMILGAWLLRERHMLQQKAASVFASLAGLTMIFWR